jgi:hypothetical protein
MRRLRTASPGGTRQLHVTLDKLSNSYRRDFGGTYKRDAACARCRRQTSKEKPMKLFKMSGALALAAMIVLALVGSSTAGAATTVLCKIDESPCPEANQWTLTQLEAKAEPFKLLTSIVEVECTSSTLTGALGQLLTTQVAGIESLVFVGCKTPGGTACQVATGGVGGLDLLRTNVNLGEGTLLNTEIKVKCGLLINCVYEGEPVLHLFGKNGAEVAKLTASEVVMTKIAGSFCPMTTKLDATYKILVPLPVFIQS